MLCIYMGKLNYLGNHGKNVYVFESKGTQTEWVESKGTQIVWKVRVHEQTIHSEEYTITN